MTWITIAYPMAIGACVTMALIHLRTGLRRAPGEAYLLFSLNALVVAVYACFELALACAESPAQYLALLRWLDIMAAMQVVSLAAFVWVFFGTGRKWLALLAPAVTCVALIADLLPQPKLVFLQITGIRRVPTFGGATYTVADGVTSPWDAMFYLGVFLLVVFVADASVTLWRQGARRRAGVVGGVITLFVLAGGAQAALVDTGILRTPYLLSFAYLAILVAMGMELSADLLRAAQLARELRESEQRFRQVAETAAEFIWEADLEGLYIYASPAVERTLGYTAEELVGKKHFYDLFVPAAREELKAAAFRVFAARQSFRAFPNANVTKSGKIVHLETSGSPVLDTAGRLLGYRGADTDVTERRRAEAAARELAGRLINAQEAERSRIARDLHDDFSQRLALISIELEIIGQKPPAQADAIRGRMGELSAQVKSLSSEVHRLAHELHPSKLDQLGLGAALRGFCKELAAAHEIAIEFEPRDVPQRLPKDVALCLYRIAQEALQNVVKHSGASGAKVALAAHGQELHLTVADDGAGFDTEAGPPGRSLGIVEHARTRADGAGPDFHPVPPRPGDADRGAGADGRATAGGRRLQFAELIALCRVSLAALWPSKSLHR